MVASTLCDWSWEGDHYACVGCGRVYYPPAGDPGDRPPRSKCGVGGVIDHRAQPGDARGKRPCGTGCHLHRLLARFGIRPTAKCKCNARARAMDIKGPDWCAENLDMIVDWMEEEAKDRELPFLRAAAAVLVRRAIRNARRTAAG